jgi:hypothetical protein
VSQALFETSQYREDSDVDFDKRETLRTTGPGTRKTDTNQADHQTLSPLPEPLLRGARAAGTVATIGLLGSQKFQQMPLLFFSKSTIIAVK